jgi:hypothetical protein
VFHPGKRKQALCRRSTASTSLRSIEATLAEGSGTAIEGLLLSFFLEFLVDENVSFISSGIHGIY